MGLYKFVKSIPNIHDKGDIKNDIDNIKNALGITWRH